jgi:UDP-arabinose 4-epimerase
MYYLGGSLSLIEAMRATGVDKIVFSSTCATYGIPAAGPIRESVPQLPVNSYGETELAIGRTLRWYGEPYGKRSVPLRYFNAAGADSSVNFTSPKPVSFPWNRLSDGGWNGGPRLHSR